MMNKAPESKILSLVIDFEYWLIRVSLQPILRIANIKGHVCHSFHCRSAVQD